MPSYEPPSYRTWSPKDTWLQASAHPAPKGQLHSVKQYSDGESFKAYLTYNGVWLYGDRYGLPLTSTMYLYWLSKV